MQAKLDPNSRRFIIVRHGETRTIQPRAIPYPSADEDMGALKLALIGLGLTALAALSMLITSSIF